ncbi:FecR domain-containing protein [Pedobacter sp. UYP1]|jgi:transmembrane sensor|uniref:FecR family protein n=1 Tax=Pedobacter sp. UYP1 TaxID=1756396 RepID=UPI00339717D5
MAIAEARLKILFNQYMNGSASAKQEQEFMRMVNSEAQKETLLDLMDSYLEDETFSQGLSTVQKTNILQTIFQPAATKEIFPLWTKILAAALLLVMLSVATYFIKNQDKSIVYSQYNGELVPGGNKATLTLADGTKLSLTDAANGKVAEQAGVSIRKTADGQLLYELKEITANQQTKPNLLYNTISTPAGGQYQLILPDGTHVWLNAASSLRYPASFAAFKQRRVELKGEAYFEVAKLNIQAAHIPFIVASRSQEVEVLGTHFNINSYEDEGVCATTLLEGSVKVSRPAVFEQILSPGEQALAGQDLQVLKVDPLTAIAWKNGLFKFENANIYTIMKQFSRWYNVDVGYEGKIPDNKFTGEVYRNMDASKALRILSYAKIKFRVETPDQPYARKKIVITSN